MWAAIKKFGVRIANSLRQKTVFIFIAGICYKILQDAGVIVPPDQWKYYLDVLVYALALGGFFVDFTTPGINDPEE